MRLRRLLMLELHDEEFQSDRMLSYSSRGEIHKK